MGDPGRSVLRSTLLPSESALLALLVRGIVVETCSESRSPQRSSPRKVYSSQVSTTVLLPESVDQTGLHNSLLAGKCSPSGSPQRASRRKVISSQGLHHGLPAGKLTLRRSLAQAWAVLLNSLLQVLQVPKLKLTNSRVFFEMSSDSLHPSVRLRLLCCLLHCAPQCSVGALGITWSKEQDVPACVQHWLAMNMIRRLSDTPTREIRYRAHHKRHPAVSVCGLAESRPGHGGSQHEDL